MLLVFRNYYFRNSNAAIRTFYTYTSLKTYSETSLMRRKRFKFCTKKVDHNDALVFCTLYWEMYAQGISCVVRQKSFNFVPKSGPKWRCNLLYFISRNVRTGVKLCSKTEKIVSNFVPKIGPKWGCSFLYFILINVCTWDKLCSEVKEF